MQEYVAELLRRWNLSSYIWNLLIIGASTVIGIIMYLLLSMIVQKRHRKSGDGLLRRSHFVHLVRPLSLFIPLVVFDLLLPVMRMPAIFRTRLDHVMEVLLILSFAWLMVRLIRVAQEFVHLRVNIQTADNLRQRRILTQLIYIRRVVNIIIVLLAIGAVLLTFETMRKLGTGLLAGVGVGGIIIGFAAQRSLGNLLAGFQIAFTQPIRIDDEVVVEGQFGVIEEITLTYVVVKIWDERRLVLPINYFIEKPFENWTRQTAAVHGTVFIYSDYSLPVDWLRKTFLQFVHEHPLWDQRTASLVVTDLKENAMQIRCLVSGSNSGNVFNLRCDIREQMIKAISEHYPNCLPLTRAVIGGQDGETKLEDGHHQLSAV
jgi:small-conductance mechanosensitive channel